MYCRILAGMAVTAAVTAGAVYAGNQAAAPVFKDPLSVPAEPSRLAIKSALRAITHSGERLFVAGIRGHILHSASVDGPWEQSKVPVSVDLNAIMFIDPQRGWAVGHDGVVLYTDNGGKYWYKRMDAERFNKEIPEHYQRRAEKGEAGLEPYIKMADAMSQATTDKIFLDVYFDAERKGFIVGPFGMLLRSENGGATWEPWFDRIDNPKQAHLHSIRRVGDDIYIAGEMGQVWRLNRDKDRFELTAPTATKGSLFGITGDENTLFAFGLRGRAFVSADKGQSWAESRTGVMAGISSAVMLEDKRFVAITQAGQVLLSEDGAQTFRAAAPARQSKLASVWPVGKDRVSIVGLSGLSVETIQ